MSDRSLWGARSRAELLLLAAIPLCALLSAQTSPGASSHALFLQRLVNAAVERTHHSVRYDPTYVHIPYPGGDVPADTGVCTDEVIRSYRALGVDLQKEVHEDMVKDFSAYPRRWRWFSPQPDTNIDHRRVPNLMVFFKERARRCQLQVARKITIPVTWSPTILAAMCRTLELSLTVKGRAGAT
jgi:uncharacterized protein YijF (DUF1287 family)